MEITGQGAYATVLEKRTVIFVVDSVASRREMSLDQCDIVHTIIRALEEHNSENSLSRQLVPSLGHEDE
jgi:hypothetical protein